METRVYLKPGIIDNCDRLLSLATMNDNHANINEHQNKRRIFLLLTLLTGGLNGLLIFLFQANRGASEIVNLVCAILSVVWLYLWIYHDAKLRNFKISKTVKYLIILVALIGVPIYFWRSHSHREFWFNLAGLWLFVIYAVAFDAAYFFASLVI